MYSNDKHVWKYYRKNNENRVSLEFSEVLHLYIHTSCKVFSANTEQFSVVRNNFAQSISTRYIRINPISWHGWISMRAEFFGCHKGTVTTTTVSYRPI